MRLAFDERRKFIIDELNKIEGVFCPEPKGAFYAFADVNGILQKNVKNIKTAMELCNYLLENKYLVIVPGEVFGAAGYVRFSYATSMENISEGINRFRDGLQEIL